MTKVKRKKMIRNENEFYIRFEKLCSEVEFLREFIRETLENCYKTERLLTRKEAAGVLGVSERSIDRYRDERKLRWIMTRGRVGIEKEALWELIRSETIDHAPKTRDEFERNYQKYVRDKRNTTWRSK